MNKEDLVFKMILRACAVALFLLICWGLWRSAAGPMDENELPRFLVALAGTCFALVFVLFHIFLYRLQKFLDKKDDEP